jgi:hypothetical protein
VVLTDAGGRGTFTTDDGMKVPYSRKLICRAGSEPDLLAALTVKGVACVVGGFRVQDTTGPWMRHTVVYCTTRHDVVGDLPDTVTIYPSTTSTDAYGTTRRVPSATGTSMAARVDPVSSAESAADGQRRAQTWTLTVDGDLAAQGVDAYSTVLFGSVLFHLDGDPLVHADNVGGTHSTATMRRTGPGTA